MLLIKTKFAYRSGVSIKRKKKSTEGEEEFIFHPYASAVLEFTSFVLGQHTHCSMMMVMTTIFFVCVFYSCGLIKVECGY